MATIRMTLEEVVGYFDELEDPRGTINQKHPFISVVVISLMAILAGASGPTTIAQWAQYKEAFLRRVLDLPNGVPRKDVFRRVLSLLNPTAFQTCFAAWLKRLREQAAEATEIDQPVLAVDGKTARRSHDETRCYVQLPVPSDLPNRDQWKELKSIGVAITACLRDGKETIEKRYYISSLPVGVKRFARAVRGHWGIENSCHWSLDMTFREDESRIRDRHLRENFAWLNRFLLSLLKQHPSKNSIVGRRRGCAWNDDFLLEVLTGTTT